MKNRRAALNAASRMDYPQSAEGVLANAERFEEWLNRAEPATEVQVETTPVPFGKGKYGWVEYEEAYSLNREMGGTVWAPVIPVYEPEEYAYFHHQGPGGDLYRVRRGDGPEAPAEYLSRSGWRTARERPDWDSLVHDPDVARLGERV